MNISDIYRSVVAKLLPQFGEGEATSIARILFEDLFGKTAPQLAVDILDSREIELLNNAVADVLDGKPVDYVTGIREFYGRRFQVSPSVLIPRQETEELVQWILEDIQAERSSKLQILDIGTGSGCIPITIDLESKGRYEIYGIDVSKEALSVAERNRIALGANVTFSERNVLEDSLDSPSMIDVIVSNPPYILDAERHLMNAQVLNHEPDIALFVDGSDPLLFYKAINRYALRNLKPGRSLYYEISALHKDTMVDLMKADGFIDVEARKDISGNWRMIKAIKH